MLASKERKRFESKIALGPGCQLWMGVRSPFGYGKFGLRGRLFLAHRLSYELYVGQIPASLEIDHLCRTPSCVNPEHLEVVSHLENIRRGSRATKTHCKRGHPYSTDNTYLRAFRDTQHRGCKECKRESVRRFRQKECR